MPTPLPSPLISLSPPSAGECRARCTALSAHSSPPPVPSPLLPSSGCPTQIQTLRIASTQALVDAVTAALPSLPLPPLLPSLYIPPPVDHRDDIPESERPPRKRSCLFALGPRYEVEESSTARPTGGQRVQGIENEAKTLFFSLKDMPQISPSIALVPVSSIMEPEDSLIMGNEELSTIPEKESDEFIKSSVEDLIPIPRESEDTSGSDSESILPSSDDFSPIFEEKSVTFSNPLFDSNDDFTSSDDESLSDEDVPEDVKIYSNPLFEFDDEYISSDVNPLFDEVLEDIECEDSYDSNLDESTFCQTLSII
ncbi:hypothetical protein Tco_0450797 [Tanacetum coccineum]